MADIRDIPPEQSHNVSRVGPRSPSRWHDQAWRREAKHETMQASLLAFLRKRPIIGLPKSELIKRTVEGEYAIKVKGEIVAYADAVEILEFQLLTVVSLFEVKPQIDDLFAIVRQAKALLHVAERGIPANYHHCHLIVPRDDPKLNDLRSEWPTTWAWGWQPTRESEGID